jgi:hypothetical protein
MSLSDRLSEVENRAKVSACKIGILINGPKISQKEKVQLEALLSVPEGDPTRVPNVALAKVLREEGHDISNSAMDRHRRNDCSCYRKIAK